MDYRSRISPEQIKNVGNSNNTNHHHIDRSSMRLANPLPPPVPRHNCGRESPSAANLSDNSLSRANSSPSNRSRGAAYWKDYLYRLQELAPRPILIRCSRSVSRRPPFYGPEFHGLISREEADELLIPKGDGAFLVRESQRSQGSYTLCMRYNAKTNNYKLYYDNTTATHYVGDKRFECIADLVHDGLICMFMDDRAKEYISSMGDDVKYEESPYSQYNKYMTKQKSPNGHNRLRDRHPSQGSLHSVGSESNQCTVQKEHQFKAHTFRMAFCDYCGNFLWGLVQQGERCQDCGFAVHRKCRTMAQNDCRPDLKYVRRMYGVDLTTLCMAHNCLVPPVVELCIAAVERRALTTEGVYRVSGSHEDMERLKAAFDSGATPDLDKIEDVHTVAGLLKLYLRQLPLRLIPYHAAKQLETSMRQSKNENSKLEAFRTCLQQLPRAHVPCLRLLASHLFTVALHSEQNRMTAENLARIFAMSIFYCNQDEQLKVNPSHVLTSHDNERNILVFMINRWKQIFGE